MRIGIDGGCLANRRGFGRFARRTLAALAEARSPHEFVVLVDRPSLDGVRADVPGRFEVLPVEVREAPAVAASAAGRRRLGDLLAMGRAAAGARLDLLFFPATYSYFPVWGVPRVVVTMHDTLALARPDLVFPTRAGKLAWRIKEGVAARQADLILTVSEASRRDLLAWFRLPGARVRVIPEGPDPAFGPLPPGTDPDAVLRARGIGPGERYLLYVGGLSPHKNLLRLVAAFAEADAPGVRLVLVGDTGDVFHTHVPEIRAEVERLGLGGRVLFTGFVPDAELAVMYTRAEALVQPSILEGFGLPPLEAMACGVPVVHSRTGSLPEVVGDAGLAFDPTDVAGMAGSIKRILSDRALRDRLAARATERAGRFTWSAAAREILSAFDSLNPARTERPRRPYSLKTGEGPLRNTKAS